MSNTLPTIVNIILVEQESRYAKPYESIVKTLSFVDVDEAYELEKNFGNKFLNDGTESYYKAEVTHFDAGASAELVFKIVIAYGMYVVERELLTDVQIAAKPAIASACANPNSAFALNKQGEVIELEGNNVGIFTFYTLNSSLALELNSSK